jgi:hypothetical protein
MKKRNIYIKNILKDIQDLKLIDKNWISFKSWYYERTELLMFLISSWKYKIKNFHKSSTKFGDLFWTSRASVRNGCMDGRIIFLKEWKYNKIKLIDYIESKNKKIF